MRTIVNGTTKTACDIRFKVKDSSGSWQDISGRVFAIDYEDSLDADSCSITVRLRNAYKEFVDVTPNVNLDPLDQNSTLNQVGGSYSPLLARYHECTLEISKDSGTNWYEVFRGFVGPGSVNITTDVSGNDIVEVRPVDLSFPWKEAYWYDSLIYKDAAATSIMSQMFADQGFSQSVTVIDEPGYHIEEYATGEINLWEAQQKLIEPTGYSYRIKWYGGAFKPCVYDPDRDNTTPDATFNGDFRSRRIQVDERDVRTKVVVRYKDRNSGAIKTAQAEDDDARLKYGLPDGSGGRRHKLMVYVAQGSGGRQSMIDTPGEAETLAGYILHDLKEPSPSVEVELPYLHPGIEIHDLLSFVGNDYTVMVGVTSVSWSWSVENKVGQTNIRGAADRIIGQYRLWLNRDARSPDVRRENEQNFMAGDGLPPPMPDQPTARTYWGNDSSTGADVPVVVFETTPVKAWDLANYEWLVWVEGEEDPRMEITRDPRLVLKGLPVGAKVKARVRSRDWSTLGG